MLRDVHDASAGSELAGDQDVVIHNDIAPWNTISRDGQPVAFTDFDAAMPGPRLDDVAYMLWTFLDVGSDLNLERVQHRIGVMVQAYGLESRQGLAGAILRQQHRVLAWRELVATTSEDESLRAMSSERVDLIRNQISWVEQHAAVINGG
jgi:aminoglycoside phosphotransferase (APT) family kinase protein